MATQMDVQSCWIERTRRRTSCKDACWKEAHTSQEEDPPSPWNTWGRGLPRHFYRRWPGQGVPIGWPMWWEWSPSTRLPASNLVHRRLQGQQKHPALYKRKWWPFGGLRAVAQDVGRRKEGLAKALGKDPEWWRQDLQEVCSIVQSSKVRPIDNYSESQVNDAAIITNKCTVDGVDTIAAMASTFVKSLKESGSGSTIQGRAFDLKSAYRQLAVRDECLKWARIATYDPHSKETVCFQQYTMPFGARASVVAFLRCARMLQWISHRLHIVSSCYFDDFVLLTPVELAKSTEDTFQVLLDLLGWDFDKEGDEAGKMGSHVSALGVSVDLSHTAEGIVKVENTDRRKQELSERIAEVLRQGKLSKNDAASLRGRLGFAEGQLFGRVTRQLLNDLHVHSQRPPKGMVLSTDTRASLSVVDSRLLSARPRVVDMRSSEVLFVYTDASFNSEDGRGGVGGVLFDASGCVTNWFGGAVEQSRLPPFDVWGTEARNWWTGNLRGFDRLQPLV